MASPIFTSNPSPGFSILAIIRGIQLAALGIYRSLQNPELAKPFYYERAFVAIAVSVALQLALRSPLVFLQIFDRFVRIFSSRDLLKPSIVTVKELFNVLNFGVFVASLAQHFSRDLDDLFLASMSFMDSIPHSSEEEVSGDKYHENLVSLTNSDIEQHPLQELMKSRYACGKELTAFIVKYSENSLTTLAMYLILRVPFIGPLSLGFITFMNLNDKIGMTRSMVVFAILLSAPHYYSVLFWNTYWGSRNMINDLLLPYFSRVRFTKLEKEHWIRSREGVLFGFSLFIYLAINRFPWISLLIYAFAESAAAYLITKVSEPPPSQASQLIEWTTTQVVWDKEKEKSTIEGEFIHDIGFRPIPGSFIWK